MSGCLVRYIV